MVDLPAPVAVLVGRMDGEHRRRLTPAGHYVLARRQRKYRLLHDLAVFLEPPIRAVELPASWRYAACFVQALVVTQVDTARAGIDRPQSPGLSATTGGRTRIAERRDVLGRDSLELHWGFIRGVDRLKGAAE